jgi:hypothetical protein
LRANAQFTRIRLFDELDLLQAFAHLIEHRNSGFEQRPTVMRGFDSRNAAIKELDAKRALQF